MPDIAGTVVGVLAAISLLTALIGPFRRLIRVPRTFVDDYLFPMPATSLAWTVVLALVAVSLSLRKRVAWWLTVIFLLLYGLVNLLTVLVAASDPGYVTQWRSSLAGLIVDALLLTILAVSYRQFHTRVRRGAVLGAAAVLAVGLAAGTFVGWGLVSLWPRSLEPHERLPYAFNHVVAFATIDVPGFTSHHAAWVVNWLLGLFGAAALIAAAVVLFRSQRLASLMTSDDERVIRALLAVYGDDDSLGYFSTRRDKAVVFSPDARAAITYRVELSTAVAGGDPIGDPDSWTEAVAEFVALCERYGWRPAALGTGARGAQAYVAAGFKAINIGDEAILDVRGFSLSGSAMKGVRGSVSRVKRLGISVRMRRMSELSVDEVLGVVRRADQWRDTDDERGFAMALGRVGDPDDGDCLLVEAVQGVGGADERVIGMLSFVPWGTGGVSLDLMRRDRSGPNGVVETMVSELARNAGSVGVTRISLNFATFRDVFEYGAQVGARPVMRVVYGVLKFFSKFFQMESLYKSNAKYRPDWVPRFICYEDGRATPRVALASMVAEGFVRLPGARRRMERSRGGVSSIPAGVDVSELCDELAAEARDRMRPAVHRPEQVRVRLDKLARLRADGVDAYPPARPPTHTVAEARAVHGTEVRVAGRVTRKRDFGGVAFADLHDRSGGVQVLVESAAVTGQPLDFAETVDLGDLVEVTGTVGTSRSGELSVLATHWRLNGKCLHPLPDKWAGLADPEARVRQRYVDLAVNARSRALLETRSTVVRALRDQLASRGYLEVETPILQAVHGGANATPFRTHINAYGMDLYLRIAPELYLKRLCVGGVEKVFEIGRNFRNEGVDFSHNPEFTSLEAYAAHGDYQSMRELTRELIIAAATAANGAPVIERIGPDGETEVVDISGPWPVTSVHAAVSAAAGSEVTPASTVEGLRELCRGMGIAFRPDWDAGHLVLELYEQLVEKETEFPTFYIDFPTSTSPLTRGHRSIDGVAERWDLVAWGMELGTAYTELTDPVEQRARLTEQSILAAGGDAEAMELDEDFLTALEYAMPPTGGLGLGVDRIVMLITGQSIRESLAFPLARPEQ